MLSARLFVLSALLAAPAFALSPLQGLDDGRTPVARRMGGLLQGRAADVNDAGQCSATAKQNIFGIRLVGSNALVTIAGRKPVPAQAFVTEIASTINKAVDALVSAGDNEILQQRVCVGLYNWGEINARSYPQGYIMVDPMVIGEMQNLPNHSMFSDQQVYLHEFAHQLQFRYGNVFAADRTTRRSELTADCVASALLAFSWRGLSEDLLQMETLGVIASAERVGDDDVNDPNHHGTSAERAQMVKAGINVVKAHFSLVPTGRGLTSRAMLNRCAALTQLLKN